MKPKLKASRRNYTAADDTLIRALHAEGRSSNYIAKATGRTRQSILNHMNNMGLVVRDPALTQQRRERPAAVPVMIRTQRRREIEAAERAAKKAVLLASIQRKESQKCG